MEGSNIARMKAFSIPENTDLNDLATPRNFLPDSNEESKTLMQKSVWNTPVLKRLLEKIEVIDFAHVASIGMVTEVRRKLNGPSNLKNRDQLNEELNNYMPDDEGKYVIIIRYLIFVAENNNCGLAVRNSVFYVYDENYWKEYSQDIITGFLESAAQKSGLDWIKVQKASVKDKLLKQFISTANFEKDDISKETKINLRNGTLIITNEDLVPRLKKPNPEDFCTYVLDFDYDPAAKAPLFKRFLDRVLPDQLCQHILFEFIGSIFTGMKLEKALFLTGPGGNGKSVVFEVIRALLGDANVSYHTMDDLCDSKSYHRADLGQKLLNYQPEIKSIKDMDMFKKLVTGEPVDARSPYGPVVTIKNYCKFMYNANNLPNVEQTTAFFRRIAILPFTQTISDEEKDIDLHNKIIKTELGGVLNLVLEGLSRLISQGDFTKSPISDEQLKNYKKESDPVQLFLADEGWVISLEKIPLKALYQQFRDYCMESGYYAISNIKFTKRLESLNFKIGRYETNNATNVYCEKQHDKVVKEMLMNAKIIDAILGAPNKD